MDLTVACLFVKGHVPFTVEYVAKLRAMTQRHVSRPHRFVCLTDRPKAMPHGVEPIAVPPLEDGIVAWWRKLLLFSDLLGNTGRVLYLDLDTVVIDSLDPIIDYPATFALTPDGAPKWKPKNGLRVVKRFNGSVMVFDAGSQRKLIDTWTPAVAKDLYSDQDWIGEQCPEAVPMPIEWFPRLSQVPQGPPFGAGKVLLSKVPKNHEAVRRYPWFGPLWSAA